MKKNYIEYSAPSVLISEIGLQGFLCASIDKVTYMTEVDEEQTKPEEEIGFGY